MSARLQLRISESRYRRLFETAQDGILILDASSGEVTDVNPFLQQRLGYPHDYFLGKKLWELGSFKDIPESKAAFQELQKKEYVRYEDLPLKTADGQPFQVEFISNVYMVDGAKVIQCNIRDISARKKAEQKESLRASQLEVSNQKFELFASSAINGMEEKLHKVINLGELLQGECRDMLDKNGKEYLALILQNVTQVQALLNDLVAYSRAGQKDPAPDASPE